MITLYNIDPHSSVNVPFLFREMDASVEKLVVRELYRNLSCRLCGKITEEQALKRGFPSGLRMMSKRPYTYSAEFIHLVDSRGKAVFSDLLTDHVRFCEIPSSGFWVVMAAHNVVPTEGDPGYRFLRKCSACGRFRELLWDRSNPAPLLRSTSDFVSIRLEGGYGVIDSWYVSQNLADRLESISPPLTGLVITPKTFSTGP